MLYQFPPSSEQVNDDYSVSEETVGIFLSLATAAVSAGGGVLVEKYLTSFPTSSEGDLPAAQLTAQQQATTTLWEQQGVLSVFSTIFAGLYVVILHGNELKQGTLFEGWNHITLAIMFMQALQGILVAMTIQKCGIVFRLILGTISICLCILIEGLIFLEPVVFRELLSITLVITGSNLYTIAKPASAPEKEGTSRPSRASASGTLVHDQESGENTTSLKGDESLASSTTTQSNKAYNSVTLRRVTFLLLVALVYISASSSFSVMLASKARVENKILQETETESLLKVSQGGKRSHRHKFSFQAERGLRGNSFWFVLCLVYKTGNRNQR